MSREVVETYEYGDKVAFEVEEYVQRFNEGRGAWSVILNRVSESLQFENLMAARSFAEEHSKLYHRNTRVIKVTPEKRAS